jgi:sarcosine oxidase subunit gamma
MPELPVASPTAGLPAIAGAGVTVSEAPAAGKLLLRLDSDARVRADRNLRVPVPIRPLSAGMNSQGACLWLGPDEWLLVVPPAQLREARTRLEPALRGTHHAIVDVSHRTLALRLTGPGVREALAAGCPLDLHPGTFPPGAVARTLLGKIGITLHLHPDGSTFDLYVDRSLAEYAWLFLAEAARELNA